MVNLHGDWLQIVLATALGNPPAVHGWTRKMVQFDSRTDQTPNQLHLGGPNPYPNPSTCGFCRDWLDLSVPISGSHFRVFIFMVAFRHFTVKCKI